MPAHRRIADVIGAGQRADVRRSGLCTFRYEHGLHHHHGLIARHAHAADMNLSALRTDST